VIPKKDVSEKPPLCLYFPIFWKKLWKLFG